MSRKNFLSSHAIITNGDMSETSLTSSSVDIRYLDNVWIQMEWTGAPVGAFYIDASDNGTSWVPGVSNQSAGTTPSAFDLNQISAPYVRLRYVKTSGTGTLQARVSGKML